jgi:phage baseplate assembly protein gpV
MAVFMNAKGTSNTEFMFGKRGGKIFGGTTTPSGAAIGDLWFDKSNSALKLAGGSEGSITWSNLTVQGGSITTADLEVTGNLTVSGTTTTLNTQTLNVEDNIIVLNSNFSGADNIVDAGIEVERGDETNVTFLWDESEGEWTLGAEVLNAGAFIGNLTGDVTGNVQPNGGPNSVTANTLTASATLNVTGATITGLSTSSVSEGSNKYYTDERVDDRVNALIQGGNGITSTYNDSAGTLTLSRDADLEIGDFVDSAYMATGETWADDDSTFATTAAIADRIDVQIAASDSAVHITGNETITGSKTISGATLTLTANSTLDVSNATVTGANSDSISEGSTNLYFSNPRARAAISVTDSSNQLAYNSSTGVISFTDAGSTAGGSNTQIQFNDGGVLAGDSDLVFDKSTNRLTVTNLTVDSNFNITSDYGTVAEAVTVTDSFGGIDADTREPTPHANYTVTEAGSITGMVAGDMIFVSNETGGATMAFYDGTNWRRIQDRAVIS